MTRILKFRTFNEGFFSSLFGSDDSRAFDDDLAEYDIERESVNKHRMEFFHNDRLVAIVELDQENISSRPNWLLTIFLYESETPKKGGFQQTDQIKKQKEQPYGKITKQMGNDSEDVVNSFVKWWSKYTKSGRYNNPLYEV